MFESQVVTGLFRVGNTADQENS